MLEDQLPAGAVVGRDRAVGVGASASTNTTRVPFAGDQRSRIAFALWTGSRTMSSTCCSVRLSRVAVS
ncbi:hypothetical protein G7085_06420 [Tessaracoccus sp. HDW20]|uniref:hypothetical protein n=1 Tax=Tessaracoccus coleopterorum TaxID=2714950 RepID=UPI0018D2DCC4|nr:hypothetical protein [Tessaracoccus coleopterorum]NHB84362.1 hypothetical protein [Tessaracoccus coleopterorum]